MSFELFLVLLARFMLETEKREAWATECKTTFALYDKDVGLLLPPDGGQEEEG